MHLFIGEVASPLSGKNYYNAPFQITIGKILVSPEIPLSALFGSQLSIVLTVWNREPLALIVKLCESLICKGLLFLKLFNYTLSLYVI